MKSPRHPVIQAAEPFSGHAQLDPAGTHCADGANVSDDAPCTTELYGQRTGHYGWDK